MTLKGIPKRLPAGYFFLSLHAHEWGDWREYYLWPFHFRNLIGVFQEHFEHRWLVITKAEYISMRGKDLQRLLARAKTGSIRLGRRYYAVPGENVPRLKPLEPEIKGFDFCWLDTDQDPREAKIPAGLGQMIRTRHQPPPELDALGTQLACILHDNDITDLYVRGRDLRRRFLAAVIEYFLKNRFSPGWFDNASDRYLRRVRTVDLAAPSAALLERLSHHAASTGLYSSVDDLRLGPGWIGAHLWKGVPAWPGCDALPRLEKVNQQMALLYEIRSRTWRLGPVVKAIWPYDPRTGGRKPAMEEKRRPQRLPRPK